MHEKYRRMEENIRSQRASYFILSCSLEQTEQFRKDAGASLHSSWQNSAGGSIIRRR